MNKEKILEEAKRILESKKQNKSGLRSLGIICGSKWDNISGAITVLSELVSFIEADDKKISEINKYLKGTSCLGYCKVDSVKYDDEDNIVLVLTNETEILLEPNVITEFLEKPFDDINSVCGDYTVLAQVSYSQHLGVICACYDERSSKIVYKPYSELTEVKNNAL